MEEESNFNKTIKLYEWRNISQDEMLSDETQTVKLTELIKEIIKAQY